MPDAKENRTMPETAKWKISEEESVEIVRNEAEEALVVASVISIDVDHAHLATGAGIVTVNPHLAANSILTSHLAPTEVAAQLGPHLALDLTLDPPPAPLPAPRHADTITADAIGLRIADAEATADHAPAPPAHETVMRRDAIRTTVIDTDPIHAVNHPAHEVPEETDGNAAQSPAA